MLRRSMRWCGLNNIPMRLIRLLLLHALALLARPFVRRSAGPVQRILYIKPDHLGDVLLATPALAALRVAFPQAEITALVGPWARLVLELNPTIDRLLDCPFPGFERAAPKAGLLQPYALLLRYATLLRPQHYDLAIIGRDDHWWGAALALLAGVPQRVGFAVAECEPFLSVALPWDRQEHVTRQGLALVAACHGEHAGSVMYATYFNPAPSDLEWAAAWLETHLAAGERFVIIHPGTGGPAKHWLADRWSLVGDALSARGLRVILTGGPGEQARVAQVAAGMTAEPLDLAGATSFGQLAALMAQAALVLGVDSGPLHLAAATGARTIHLYGPGDEQRFGPWGEPARHTVLHTELFCRPCGVLHACPRGLAVPECMERITVGDVLAAVSVATLPEP